MFILVCYNLSVSQTNDFTIQYNKDVLKINRKISRNPLLLAKALTAGKTTEKEKFDAIFAWVAANIRYNYYIILSSTGTPHPSPKRTLKYKAGVCVDYANLMDTLCGLAGITNVSVYGYAKDEVFDVYDSLYVDNHAWNSVRLDGKWYLYDVTWASGRAKFHYTKWSMFILKLRKRCKTKRIIFKLFKIKKKWIKDCDGELATTRFDTISLLRYKHPLWHRFLMKRKLSIVSDFEQEIDTSYYLCEPEKFGITHIPDNPVWSLIESRSIREYETDSAYYHFDDSIYKKQNRYGRACGECLNEQSLDPLNKEYNFRKKSFEFNPKNRFVPFMCEYNIANLKQIESRKYADSLTKVSTLDTAINYIQLSKDNIARAYRSVELEYMAQRTKNIRKNRLITDENYDHINFIKERINKTIDETRHTRELDYKIKYNLRYYLSRDRRIIDLRRNIEPNLTAVIVQKNIDELNAIVISQEKAQDSLNKLIAIKRHRFDSLLPILTKTIWKQMGVVDSMRIPLWESMDLRAYKGDAYKKDVVTQRNKLWKARFNYTKVTDSALYIPSKLCHLLIDSVFEMIKVRNELADKNYQTKIKLIKYRQLNPKCLDTLKIEMRAVNKDDYCWILKKSSWVPAAINGFYYLKLAQLNFYYDLREEIRIDNRREYSMNGTLSGRKYRYRNILRANNHVISKKMTEIKKEKREYLKMLRKERREAARRK